MKTFEICLVSDSKANGFDTWDEWKAEHRDDAVMGWLADGVCHMNPNQLRKYHKIKVREGDVIYTMEAKLGITITNEKKTKEVSHDHPNPSR